MTIGWGVLGYMWNRPVMMAPVRFSRYTYELIHDAHVLYYGEIVAAYYMGE